MTAAALPRRGVPLRLFVTCWLIFCLHFATDIVREHYLAFSLAEDYSFRMDKYLGFHVDIFDTPGHGAHIGNNPGVSMVGAIPYLVVRPIIDRITNTINARRAASGQPVTAIYDDPRPRRVEFYRKVREQGLDIRFGLASAAIHVLFMAPLSAFAAVVIFNLLGALGLGTRPALLGAFLYALGTPIFFRTAFINQNVFIAHLALFGFTAVWRPGNFPRWTDARGCVIAGLMGGYSLLSDYSGAVVLAWLGLYAAWRGWRAGAFAGSWHHSLWYVAGAAGPVLLLLFYQYRAFGSPWYPGQHYMPRVEWIDIGYQGVGWPEWRLFKMLLFDTRFGLLTSCPWLALSIAGVVMVSRQHTWLPRTEALFLAAFSFVFLAFFSAVQYTQLQWVTGVRYVLPVVPALFLLAFVALLRLPPLLRYTVVVLAFTESWCLSMVRAIEISDSIARVLLGGFQLPWVNVLAKMAPQYLTYLEQQSSPLALLVLVGALVYGIWRVPTPESV
jgi:MFS family permease